MFANVEKYKLYLVVLGGRSKSSNVELHDVRWVVGTKIDDTFQQLRDEWFGSQQGLHIDSYLEIKYIDGYEIFISRNQPPGDPLKKNNNFLKSTIKSNKLWFVNIGGYNKNQLLEQHEFGLVVASSALEAKRIARAKFLRKSIQQHTDDCSSIISIDDCHLLNSIGNWSIKLRKDSLLRSQKFVPDWFGFLRIDSQDPDRLPFS
ncbi:DUF1543 domain-containing protein [Prochlorococcus sp. MIT 1307]|uniref:DUF1543 domain-containing protein n=1 Tax=Prochlorococcus sp. MIT 1307 TaxID=3096219 RepID=UPI002A75711F|nr:DUF1543 domain-containing protein [Prochlorococcus sp. MIT 1307]